VGEYSFVWPKICRVLSQIQWRFLRGILGKNYFGRIFQKLCANQGYPLPKLVKFRYTFWSFILGSYCAEKIHTSNFICCLYIGKEPRLYQTTKRWYFALLSQILFWVRITLAKLTQVLSYGVFTQVRRHVHKQATRRRYGEENPERFVFRKLVFFTLSLRLTTPYSLGILVWNFYQTFVIVFLSFGWYLSFRFVPQEW